jgi:flagellar motor protein MotB
MRNLARVSREEEEEESVFVPMTDMTVSFLFILMLLLAFFAVQITDTKTVPIDVYDKAKQALEEAEHKIVDLQQNVDALIRQAEALRAEREQLIQQIKDRDEKLNSQAAEILRLKAQVDRLQEEIRRLEALLREKNPLEAYIQQASASRVEILKAIREKLLVQFPNLQVDVSPEQDALRFQGEGLFASGVRELVPDKRAIIERIAELMNGAITCFTLHDGPGFDKTCNPNGAIIDAVQIEGHTDGNGTDELNIDLSTARANAAFLAIIQHEAGLLQLKNVRRQPVLSVAGYGKMRPIADNATVAGRSANRRIDLRIIMYTPGSIEEVDRIRSRISQGLAPSRGNP